MPPTSTNYVRGDVVEVDLGKPPEAIQGHEQGYRRPCIVIKAYSQLQLAIIVPSTTTVNSNFYTIVKLNAGCGGLTEDSYIHCHQIRCVSYDRIKSKLGTLVSMDYNKIRSVLTDIISV